MKLSRSRIPLALVLSFFTLTFLACSGGSSDSSESTAASGIEVSGEGFSASISPVSGAVLPSTVTDSVLHTIVVANYDLGEKPTKFKVFKSAKKLGQERVHISVIGAKGSEKSTPLTPGEYPARVKNEGSTFRTANGGAYIRRIKEGRPAVSNQLDIAEMEAGKVIIDSVDGGVVSGKVDLTDGKMTIKGSFSVPYQPKP